MSFVRQVVRYWFIFASISLVECEQELKICSDGGETIQSSNCEAQRVEDAALRHHLILHKYTYKRKVTINCPLCSGDNHKHFVWYFNPRSSEPIFKADTEEFVRTTSLIPPGGKRLTQDGFVGDTIPCILNSTNALLIPSFSVACHLGTYYCRNTKDEKHLSNLIWYHLDVIDPMDMETHSEELRPLPQGVQKTQKISRDSDIEESMGTLGSAMMKSSVFRNFDNDVISVTSVLSTAPKALKNCGTFNLLRYRKCYVTIPQALSDVQRQKALPDLIVTYDLLLATFKSFYAWNSESNPTIKETQRKASEDRAVELGFELHFKEEKFHIPCHFTYFQHLASSASSDIPNPFETKNLFVNITYEKPCPEVDPMEIVNMALSGDVAKMKTQILGYEEKRFMKIEKVAIDGTENYEMICGGEGDVTKYNCSSMANLTILWKQPKGMTFMLRTFVDERVYVTSGCDLHFHRVKKSDEGLYSCYKRDTRYPSQWQSNAFVTFRLKIEQPSFKFPVARDILLGLLLLTCWAIFLALLWVAISIWNLEVNKAAIIQAGERRRRRDKLVAIQAARSDRR